MLRELRLGVLGMGAIGRDVARAGRFFGMEVRGLVRHMPEEPMQGTCHIAHKDRGKYERIVSDALS